MNKYTLLAATAILSMSAMTASATDTGNETTSVPVKVEIIPARTLSATALDFGRIVAPVSADTGEGITQINLSMSSAGVTTITSQTKAPGYNGTAGAYILKQGTQGVVTGATCAELAAMPASVGLDDVSEVTSVSTAGDTEITLSNIACNTADGKAYIYGDLAISSAVDNIAYEHGIYKGSFTVTAVY